MAGSTSQDEAPSTSSSSAPLMRFRQRVSSTSSSSAAGAINPPANANTLMMSPMVSVSSNMNTAATPSQPVFSSTTGVHMGNGNTLELHQDAVGGTNSKEGEEHEGEAEGGAEGLKLESSEATEQEFQRMLHESEEGRSEEEEKEKGGNGVVNSGSSNIKTDRHGNHYVMLTNNNVLAQSLPSAAQQMSAAMASQMVAQQMVDLMKRRMEHETEMMKEKEKIAQLQAQIAQAAAAGQQPPAPAPGTVTPAAPGAPGAPQSPQQQADAIAAAAIAAQQAAAEAKRRLAITFQDPWQNYGEGYEDLQAYRVGPLCVVQGMVKGNAGLVATLGPDCRPAGGRVVFALIRGNVVSRIDVMADGRVYVIAGGNDGWLSLSGLSFPVVPDRNPDLLNKWVDYGDNYKPASITKIGDLCVLGGMIRSGDWNVAFGRVTSDCFPNQRLVFSGDNHVGITEIDVLNTGYFVRAGGANEHGWVSLEGMGWCMAEGGNNLPQKNDWFPLGQDYRPPRYCMVQNLCVLSGVVKNDVDWNQVITELPQPCRPTKRLVFGTNVLLNSARVDVFPDGRVQYVSGKSNWAWLSLDGIKFIVADTGVAPGPTIPGSSAPVSQVVPALPSPIPASPAAMNAAAPGASSTPSPKN